MTMQLYGVTRVPEPLWGEASLRNRVANSIPIELGETITEQIKQRDRPMVGIQFDMIGETSTSSAGTDLNTTKGPYALIETIEILRSGNRPIWRLKGEDIEMIHRLYHRGNDPLTTGWTDGASQAFHASFFVPFDLGGNVNLLDVSMESSLDIQVKFRDATAGASGFFTTSDAGTVTLSSDSKIHITPFYVHGINDPAIPGAKGYAGYLNNNVTFKNHTIDAARSDYPIVLTHGRGYHGLTLICEDDSVRSDDLLNGVRLVRNGDEHMPLTAEKIRAHNVSSYRMTNAELVGVYHIPFVRRGHLEDIETINATEDLRLICDVLNPAGTNVIRVVEHYFGR